MIRRIGAVLALLVLLTGCGGGSPSVPEEVTVPEVVGLALDEAATVLEDAGFDVEAVDSLEDRAIIVRSNWVVTDQDPQAGGTATTGTTIHLGAMKDNDTPGESTEAGVETAPAPDGREGPEFAAEVERAVLAVFGVDSLSEACNREDPGWSCYVAGWESPSEGTVVVTLQLGRDDSTKDLGYAAATSIFTLVGLDIEDLTMVQAVAADGGPLATVTRSEIPPLNN